MIPQDILVQHTYLVLSMEVEARAAGEPLFPEENAPCSPLCVGCACARAYRELDPEAFRSGDVDVRLEIGEAIVSALQQIANETGRPS